MHRSASRAGIGLQPGLQGNARAGCRAEAGTAGRLLSGGLEFDGMARGYRFPESSLRWR